jgi:hypothetical protein
MTTQIVRFAGLSEQDRRTTVSLPKLEHGDRMELHVRREDGQNQALFLPPSALAAIETLLAHLLNGERVAMLTEDQEVSPNDAASVLGISRPLVVHRMDIGDLPFRYVGKHRRAKLKDVLALKLRIDTQRAAMEALADDAEDINRRYGV